MYQSIHLLNILLPILYAITLVVYLYDFLKEQNTFTHSKRVFILVTSFAHLYYLFARTIEFNHPPITNVFEIFTVLAFSIACSYFILELLTDIRKTGTFILVFALFFQIISSLFIQDLTEVKEVLKDRLLGVHVITALLGYSGITISAVYGFLFLILEKQLKVKNFGLIFNRLPSLETLEKLCYYSTIIGFALLTAAIFIGIIWLPAAFPDFSYLDPKLIATSIVWILYGVGISIKFLANWHGKKFIIFSMIGFAFAFISIMITNFLSKSFHSFY